MINRVCQPHAIRRRIVDFLSRYPGSREAAVLWRFELEVDSVRMMIEWDALAHRGLIVQRALGRWYVADPSSEHRQEGG